MTSQWVERTWIRTGGYGRFRGEWVKVSRVIDSSDNSILILRYVYFFNVAIALLSLCQAFTILLLIVNLKAHNDQFSDN